MFFLIINGRGLWPTVVRCNGKFSSELQWHVNLGVLFISDCDYVTIESTENYVSKSGENIIKHKDRVMIE